jgi:hypothetical protein
MQVQPKFNEVLALTIGRDAKLSVQLTKSSEALLVPDLVPYELFDGDANHVETLASVTRQFDSPQVLAEVCATARALYAELVYGTEDGSN